MNSARIAKNTLVLYVRMLVVLFVGLFTSRVQLQALGVSDYGLYNVATAVVGMFVFLNGSLSGASSRFLTVEMGRGTTGTLKRVFSTVLTVHFVLAAIFVVILETAGMVVLETKLNIDPARIGAVKWAYQCAVLTTFMSVTQVPYGAVVVAHERMSAFAWMTLYDVFAKLGIAYALMISPIDRLKLYATLLAFSSLTTILIYRIYCIRNFTEARYRKIFDWKLIRPIMTFAGWQTVAQAIIMLLTQGVVMLNQRYFGPSVVAAVSIASGVLLHVNGFIGNFKTAANPQIIKLFAARQFNESKRLLKETILFSVYILLVLGVPIWFYSDEALTIWLGSNVPQYSPVMVKIMLIGSFFSIFNVSFYSILYASGKIKANAICNLIFSGGTFVVIFALLHFLRNPLTSCIMLAAMNMLLGVFVKPWLLHRIAGYSLGDYMDIFRPSFIALGICAALALAVRCLTPSGIWWALPACALLAGGNVMLIFVFVADEASQQKCIKLISKVPAFGFPLARIATRIVK